MSTGVQQEVIFEVREVIGVSFTTSNGVEEDKHSARNKTFSPAVHHDTIKGKCHLGVRTSQLGAP